MKVAVIGAGIAGATIAAELKNKGADVTIFDGNGIANECSFANGGQLSVCNAEVWNTWKNVWKGTKWMFKRDAPLYLNPLPTPSKIAWLTEFLAHTSMNVYEKNTLETIRLGLLSRERYFSFHKIDEDAAKNGYVPSAMLHVYSNKESLDAARASASLFNMRAEETDWSYMTREQILEYDSNMSWYKSLQGGYITEEDSVVDIHKLVNRIIEKNDIRFVKSHVVDVGRFTDGIHLWTEDDGNYTFDQIVIANGHASTKFGREFGNFFNIYPVKGYSISIKGNRHSSGFPYVALLDDDKKIVSSTFEYEDGECVFRVAGTAEIGGANTKLNPRRLAPLYNWVYDNFNVNSELEVSEWACLRPMMADMMPFYNHSRFDDRIWYHIGHGHLGLTLAAGTAQILAERMYERHN